MPRLLDRNDSDLDLRSPITMRQLSDKSVFGKYFSQNQSSLVRARRGVFSRLWSSSRGRQKHGRKLL